MKSQSFLLRLILIVVLISTLLFYLFFKKRQETLSTDTIALHPVLVSLDKETINNLKTLNATRSSTNQIKLTLLPKMGITDEVEERNKPNPDYVWYTAPTTKGSVKNTKGEVVFQASEELPMLVLKSRGGIENILIISSNRNAFVINPNTSLRLSLPQQPPGFEMKGFETWELIDNETLIAEYNVRYSIMNGNRVNCCRGHDIKETKLYSFNLRSRELTEVDLPNSLKGTAFTISGVANDGAVALIPVSTHLKSGSDTNWFYLSE